MQVSWTLYSLGRIHYVYHRGGGGGRGPEDFGGFLKFLEGKRGDGKIAEGRKGRMPIFLDVIER